MSIGNCPASSDIRLMTSFRHNSLAMTNGLMSSQPPVIQYERTSSWVICAPSYLCVLSRSSSMDVFKVFWSILIIHFVLLLKESTLDSIGHDFWKNITYCAFYWLYLCLLTHLHTGFLLVHSVFNSSLRHNGMGYQHNLRCIYVGRRCWWTVIMWYKQYSIGSCMIIFGTLLEQIYPLTFFSFFMYLYICFCFLCIVICMHSFHSAHIFIVCNNVICTNSFYIV